MNLPIVPPYPPMEARTVERIPVGHNWQYEPKWDGFRCLIFRDGGDVFVQSKAEKPLGRYFPEIVEAVLALDATRFVLDGEIVIPVGGVLSFEELLQRIHPAESRIRKLAREFPAMVLVFDLLAVDGENDAVLPLRERRERLETFAAKHLRDGDLRLSPATTDVNTANKWLTGVRGGLDGVIAKRLDLPYKSGERTGMQKIKRLRTADCVVGGFRYASNSRQVGSMLLGLYDDDGLLHHVGFTSGIKAADRAALTKKLEKHIREPGFTGRAPGGPSRWSTEHSEQWVPLAPELVVEVQYDHFSEGRFRHGTRFLRWRPDKHPRQCTFDQVARRGRPSLKLLEESG